MISTQEKITIHVFGKEGCDKCSMLNRRIDKLLSEPQYARFKKTYHDVMTEDGLVHFCLAQCVNPSQIPAMLLSYPGPEGMPQYLRNPEPGAEDKVCGASKLYQFLGLQTDYSAAGKGIITPKMISSILDQALESL
ncbi:MAG: hypothetical protein GX946_08430 [Oligosphaeraceae bacterium]|nr:hypothetical protein [Oligosphaeraceae bacterium]